MSNTVKLNENGDVELVLTHKVAQAVCAIMGSEFGPNMTDFPFTELKEAIGNPLSDRLNRALRGTRYSEDPDSRDVKWRLMDDDE